MDNSTVPSIESFIENLITAKQYGDMPQDIRTEMKNDLSKRLNDSIISHAIDELPETDVDAFTELMKTNPADDKIAAFLREKIPDQATFLTQVFSDFRRTFLGIE